jgi:hypothetical protein
MGEGYLYACLRGIVLEGKMGIVLDKGTKVIWGQEWKHTIEQLPDDDNSEGGCLVDVFSNAEFGKFAALYITGLEDIGKNSGHEGLFFEIKRKWQENIPYIVYEEEKYKQTCAEWNNSSNTVCSKDDFELLCAKNEN